MLRKILLNLKARQLAALREQKGQSIIIFTFAVIGLIAMLGLALDLGLVYIEKVKVNRAADATALAAVVELPYEQDTINRAVEYIKLNGYDVGVDTEILVRGCIVSPTTYIDSQNGIHVYNPPSGPRTYWEGAPTTTVLSPTTLITGARYITASNPIATFVIDTGAYQGAGTSNCSSSTLGTATKVKVMGRVNVRMNFMQFFGFTWVPVQDEAIAENLSSLDVVVVFDISGSMEDQSICTDCWVRTSFNPNWPNNGYFNPMPYNPAWATTGTDNQSIPQSALCTVYPPQPFVVGASQYLTLEAELYSRAVGNWRLDVRTPGVGFWAIQRASKLTGVGALGEPSNNNQLSAAGDPLNQSSNVCRPNVQQGTFGAGIDCTVGGPGNLGDNVCKNDAGADISVDCSAYIAARPMVTYGQRPGNIPNLNGAAYNADCFSGGALSGACWSGNPFNTVPGLEVGPSQVPWVEYDFTPTWTQTTTYIWIRAIGGGEESYTWAGPSPDQIQPDPDNDVSNNVTPWRKVIYWQVDNGTIFQRKDNMNADYQDQTDDNSRYFQVHDPGDWRVNRARNSQWRWIKLGSTPTVSGTQYTLKLYQGSASYRVDKIVFTNDPSGTTNQNGTVAASSIPNALRRQYDINGIALPTLAAIDSGNAMGPPASLGSATREACNRCNPAYGYPVDPSECTCKRNATETGYGTGQGCTLVLTPTNMLQDELETGLYSGIQPLRSAQEAVKNFARRLDPKFDQLGIVAFTGGSDNTTAQNSGLRRSKLQCLTWAAKHLGNSGRCWDPTQGTPITYTHVFSAVENQWAQSGTNIAIGMREGLEELGVPGFATNSDCTMTANDGSACDRQGAARRIIVLMTDGSPNENPGNCAPGGGRPDLWDGLLGTEDPHFECAMYFASLAAQNNVTVYTIGIGAGANADLLTAMATGIDPRGDQEDVQMFSGGSGKFFPAAKPTDLDLIFDEILSNIYVRIVS